MLSSSLVPGKTQVVATILDKLLDSEDFLEDESKVQKATSNLFQIVEKYVKHPEEGEDNFLPDFFNICDKISSLYNSKDQKISKLSRKNVKKAVSQVSVAMNKMIFSLKSHASSMEANDISNLVKGYT